MCSAKKKKKKTGLNKQCWPRSDAEFCGVWSESTLFATYLAFLDSSSGLNIDLFKC